MLINGLEFFEDNTPERRSYDTQYAQDAGTVSRTLHAKKPMGEQDRYAHAKAILGTNFVVSDSNGPAGQTRRWIQRNIPDSWQPPDDSDINPNGLSTTWASSIPRVWPMSGLIDSLDDQSLPVYRFGLFYKVNYSSPSYFIRPDEDTLATTGELGLAPRRPDDGAFLVEGYTWDERTRYITREIKAAPKVATMAGSSVYYAEGAIIGKPVPQALPFSQYRANVKYVWHQVPLAGIPWPMMASLADRVNLVAFDFAPSGTLKYTSSDVKVYRGPLGDMLADVTHHLVFLPNTAIDGTCKGWNAIPARVAGTYDYVYVTADGAAPGATNLLYQKADFGSLFHPHQGP